VAFAAFAVKFPFASSLGLADYPAATGLGSAFTKPICVNFTPENFGAAVGLVFCFRRLSRRRPCGGGSLSGPLCVFVALCEILFASVCRYARPLREFAPRLLAACEYLLDAFHMTLW
jgi:hypothetical protein